MAKSVVVVLGASGLIGRSVVTELLAHGFRVRGVSRNAISFPPVGRGLYEHVCLNFFDNPTGLADVFDGAHSVVYAAGHSQASSEHFELFVESVDRISKEARRCEIKTFILLSSIAVYGNRVNGIHSVNDVVKPDSYYGESRARAESRAEDIFYGSDTNLRIVRIPAVVGVGMRAQVLAKMFKIFSLGVFPLLGSKNATFPCIGLRKLARLLVSTIVEADVNSKNYIQRIQVVDHIKWTDLATVYGQMTRKKVFIFPVPFRSFITFLCNRRLLRLRPICALISETIYVDTPFNESGQCRESPTLNEISELIDEYQKHFWKRD